MRAFSLVELSIVLVVLGLLTGGILAGQSLIRAAELRSLQDQLQQYRAAASTFKDKYENWPGDMPDATAVWGSAGGAGNDSTCMNAQSKGAQATCSGTGDGIIGSISGYSGAERYLAWKHMSNAGLIEGSFTGKSTDSAGALRLQAGENAPATKVQNVGFDMMYISQSASVGNYFAGSTFNKTSMNLSMFGTSSAQAVQPSLVPEDAWNIDVKLDDGSPVYGRVVVWKPDAGSSTNSCATSSANDATYNVSVKTVQCMVSFLMH